MASIVAAATELFDAEVRHSIGIRRFSTSEVDDILRILIKSDRELRILLNDSLKQGMTVKSKRFRSLIAEVRDLRKLAWKAVRDKNTGSMVDLSVAEQQFSKRIFENAIPIQFEYATASVQTLTGLVKDKPFSGGANSARTLTQWWKSVEAVDQVRIVESLQLGMVQGETVDQMVRRVRKTNMLTRTNAEAIVRTAVNHSTNVGREAFINENADIAKALMWNSMLDGRTSAICRARDRHFAPLEGREVDARVPMPRLVPPTARPPAHPSCRSQMTTVLDLPGIENMMGERPFVRDTRTRKFREKDFRKEARDRAGSRWKKMTSKERNASMKKIRKNWVKENVGTAPAKQSYDGWLRKQPVSFQNDVLGIGKGKLFRKGLKLDKFVDRQGAPFTLAQLKKAHADLVVAPK